CSPSILKERRCSEQGRKVHGAAKILAGCSPGTPKVVHEVCKCREPCARCEGEGTTRRVWSSLSRDLAEKIDTASERMISFHECGGVLKDIVIRNASLRERVQCAQACD